VVGFQLIGVPDPYVWAIGGILGVYRQVLTEEVPTDGVVPVCRIRAARGVRGQEEGVARPDVASGLLNARACLRPRRGLVMLLSTLEAVGVASRVQDA
jgi:hypothetical protein